MKPLQWFRLYAEIIDDVKLLMLAPSDRWYYVALLACKAQGLLDGEDAERRFNHVTLKLRIEGLELKELARRLAEAGLIDEHTLQPTNWDKRQFKSDHDDRNSVDRVREWRQKKRNQNVTAVTPTDGNQTVTRKYPRTETETETETEKRKRKDCAPTVPSGVSDQVWNDFLKARRALRAPVTPTSLKGIEREAKKAGMTLEAALQVCCERSWRGFKAEWMEGKGSHLSAAEQALRMIEAEEAANAKK